MWWLVSSLENRVLLEVWSSPPYRGVYLTVFIMHLVMRTFLITSDPAEANQLYNYALATGLDLDADDMEYLRELAALDDIREDSPF